jgi:hypothetical protein
MRLFEDIHDDKRGDVFGTSGNHGTLLEGTTKFKIRIFEPNTHGPGLGRHGENEMDAPEPG